MFKGKILIFVTLMCIYLLFAILIYPLISFKEQNDVYTTRMVEDFFANQISYLALENEVSSYYTNLNTDTLYASIYENPIYYKKSILEFFEKSHFLKNNLILH